jgi:hypothetical protein
MYRINFSDGPIYTLSPYSFANINTWLKVELEGYDDPIDYTYTSEFMQNIQAIDITLTINNSLSSTTLKATILDKTKIKTQNGKQLQNDSSELDFIGYQKLSSDFVTSINALNSISGATGAAVSTGSIGAVTASSLLGNSLGFLTKMIQIIEFTALMELFNVEYDRTLAALLGAISKLTDLKLLSIPTEGVLES